MPDTPQIAVSPDNPCPFLRALVANGYVGGHVVPLSKLAETIELASGEQGLKETMVGWKPRWSPWSPTASTPSAW